MLNVLRNLATRRKALNNSVSNIAKITLRYFSLEVEKVKYFEKSKKFISRKPFSRWRYREVLDIFLNKAYNSVSSAFESLTIDEIGPESVELRNINYDKMITDILESKEAFDVDKFSAESSRRILIDLFLKTLHSQTVANRVSLKCMIEYFLKGSYGYGKADYALLYQDGVAFIVEVKKEDFEQSIAQLIVVLLTAIEETEKRLCQSITLRNHISQVYGIATNGYTWFFMKCEVYQNSIGSLKIKLSKSIDTSDPPTAEDCRIILDWMLRIVNNQKQYLEQLRCES